MADLGAPFQASIAAGKLSDAVPVGKLSLVHRFNLRFPLGDILLKQSAGEKTRLNHRRGQIADTIGLPGSGTHVPASRRGPAAQSVRLYPSEANARGREPRPALWRTQDCG